MNYRPPAEFGYGRYEPPASKRGRPGIILWYRTYALVSLVGVLLFLVNLGFFAHASADGNWPGYLLGGLAALFFGVGAFVPLKPWGWTYAMLVIGLGMVGCFFMFSIPLAIFWGRPETKAAFGRV